MMKRFIFYFAIVTILVFFFTPFVGTWINYKTSLSIGDLYTFGIADRKDFFTVWIALFGAIGIAFNIYQNHLRTTNQDKQLVNQNKQLEKQAEQIQLQGTQIELQSKSQRDSRFSKGVELLGNANESARTGASYSLYFLAKDYPEEFAKPVFEVLCSHVRTITNTEEYKKNNNKRPSNEIQSILDLLFRDDQSKLIFDGLTADLKYSNLIGSNLAKANLSEANLTKTNLSEANLIEAKMSEAFLVEANLLEAYLIEADLSEAGLSYANLKLAKLSYANLAGARLIETDLSEASLSYANLSNANLSKAKLVDTNFSDANLSNAKFADTDFSRVYCSERTILDGVDVSYIDLKRIMGESVLDI